MKRFLIPLTIGVVLGIGGFCLALNGYSVPMVQLWPCTVVLVLIFSVRLGRELSSPPYPLRVIVIATMLAALTGCGHGALLLRKWAVCQKLNATLAEIESFRKAHGAYPLDLSTVHLPEGLKVHTGKTTEWGINLEGIGDADAVFYLSKDDLLCIVPVTKMLPMSFTRFYAFEWSTEEPHWKSDKIIWWLSASEELPK